MKTIRRPTLAGATILTPQELNAIRFSAKRTVLTPAVLAAMRQRGNRIPDSGTERT